jgi:maleylacetate reductase
MTSTSMTNTTFVHETLGQRVLFGPGTVVEHVSAEARRLGAAKVMLIASPREDALAARLTTALGDVIRVDDVRQHVPIEHAVATRILCRDNAVDLLLAVGGGSATGLAKAVALTEGLPIVAVPTTYSGSEGTNVWGLTEDGTKTTGVSHAVLPTSIVYDSDLSSSLPVPLSVASGLNALAHSVDALWAPAADPINRALALEAAHAIGSSLRAIVIDPSDRAARSSALYGTYLSAVAFASAGSALHHKICHVIGGTFGLPHAETHAVILPYVLAFNAPAVPELATRLAQALSGGATTNASRALDDLRAAIDAPRSLAALGLPEGAVDEVVRRTLAVVPASNPTPANRANLTELLSAAWAGTPPVRTTFSTGAK